MPVDPLVSDPPADARWPAVTSAVAIGSGGADLPGVLHVPAGPGPHPVVVLLHGFPGNERSFDATDHALPDHRVALTRAVLAFLGAHLREPS